MVMLRQLDHNSCYGCGFIDGNWNLRQSTPPYLKFSTSEQQHQAHIRATIERWCPATRWGMKLLLVEHLLNSLGQKKWKRRMGIYWSFSGKGKKMSWKKIIALPEQHVIRNMHMLLFLNIAVKKTALAQHFLLDSPCSYLQHLIDLLP